MELCNQMENRLRGASLTLAGVTIPMVEGGQGPPLLFLNGGDAFHMSDAFLELLAENFRVYAPKHPGYGGAPPVDHIRSVNELALFYLELIDHLHLRDVVLVGASFGGWVAMEIAARSCAAVSCIVLLDSVGVKFGGPTDADIADIYTLKPDVLRSLQYADAKSVQPDYAAMSAQAARAVIDDRTGEALYAWRPYMHNPVLRDWLWRVRRPTLVLWGERDGIVKPDYGRRLAQALPQSEFRMIDNAGHYPHVERPRDVVDHISRFVSRTGNGQQAAVPAT
jgi:pimeloyl-ACP methyl ester carboxylesterase